jgi:hypothetical protein
MRIQYFSVIKGDTEQINVEINQADGTDLDVTSLAADQIQFKLYSGDTVLVTKNLTSGITIVDGDKGLIRVELTPTDTAALQGNYTFEVLVVPSGSQRFTVASGVISAAPARPVLDGSYSVYDLILWLGPTWTPDPVSHDQLQAAIVSAVNYCNGYLEARGVTGTGAAYRSAVEANAKGQVCLILDSMGLKPSSYSQDSHSIASDSLGTVKYWFDLCNQRLEDAIMAAVYTRDVFIRHVRGGRGI